MEEYSTNLPPSLGWLKGGRYHKVYHLVVDFDGAYYPTLCGRQLRWPVTGQYEPPDRLKRPLCRNCQRRIDAWRRANAAEH